METDEGKRTIVRGTHVVLLEQDPPMAGYATLEGWGLHEPDEPEPHEAAAIADQLGIDLARPVATASGGGGRRGAARRGAPRKYPQAVLPQATHPPALRGDP